MKLALGQLQCTPGDVKGNLDKHLHFARSAAEQDCDLIAFPELSLTGYSPALARENSFGIQDHRLWPLQEIADSANMHVAVGAPVHIRDYLAIGMIWITPATFPVTYTKQFLHTSEEPFFDALSTLQSYLLKGTRIAPAICYESTLEKSVERTKRVEADLYLVSTAKREEKMPATLDSLSSIGKQLGIPVALVNFVGDSGIFPCVGRSSIWDAEGRLIAQADGESEGLLIYDFVENRIEFFNGLD